MQLTPDRLVVDEFLLQSLLYEFVENQSARGLMVTSSVVIAKYLQMWEYQDKTPCQTMRMAKLQRSATTRAAWCRRFRKFWDLDWGLAPKGVNMTAASMQRKAAGGLKSIKPNARTQSSQGEMKKSLAVWSIIQIKPKAMPEAAIFHQWIRWLLRKHLQNKPVVLLNMDETSVLSPLEKCRGNYHRDAMSGMRRHTFRRRGLRRCTLMAVIADDEELQRHLPQILLPRAPGGRDPGSRAKRSYESLGRPLEVWHLTAGHNSSDVMKMWLKAVAKTERDLRGDVHIVLILDCHPVHISGEIMRSARAADIHLVLVPAGCTWFLQPLDVKVFQHLKSGLRKKLMGAENAAEEHALSWNEHMRAVASAVHETLVSSTWVQAMKAMGVHREWRPTAQPLRSLLRDAELKEEAPSVGDILQIMPSSRSAGKGYLWRKLLRLPESKSAEPAGKRPPAVGHLVAKGKDPHFAELPQEPERSRRRITDDSLFDAQRHTPIGIVRENLRDHGQSAKNRPVQKESKPRAGPAAGTRSQVAKGAARSSLE